MKINGIYAVRSRNVLLSSSLFAAAFFFIRFLLFKREQGPAALAAKSNGAVCHERTNMALGVPMWVRMNPGRVCVRPGTVSAARARTPARPWCQISQNTDFTPKSYVPRYL